MRLAAQWRRIEAALPERWRDARLLLAVERDGDVSRAAALLGPANPGRSGNRIRLRASRGGGGTAPDAVERLLRRLDREGISGELELLGADEAEAAVTRARSVPLATAWDGAAAGLPDDWSDLVAEVELRSTDQLERAALLMAPLNPMRDGDRRALRFRGARVFGYGASAGMVRRCFERCDAEGMVGTVRILRALSETDPVATQGPVWHMAGDTV